MPKPAAKAILFDKDGTLLDFQASWGRWSADLIGHLAGDDAGLQMTLEQILDVDCAKRRVGPNSVIIAGTPMDIADRIAAAIPGRDRETLGAEIVHLSRKVRPVPVEGLSDTLSRLREAGMKLGVATNDAESVATSQLQAMGVSQAFDFVAGYDSGYGGKPAPGMCLAFCAAIGIGAEDCVMVGDSLHDLDAGRAAGMATVAVLTGVATRSDLQAHCDVVLPDVTHLPDWLDAQSVL